MKKSGEPPYLSSINENDEFGKNSSENKISHQNTPPAKKMVSVLDRIPEDQLFHDKILEQENKINEYEAKIFQMNEEKVKMNENLREMSVCCEDLKKEKDVLFENFQKMLELKSNHLKNKFGDDSFEGRIIELNSPSISPELFQHMRNDKPMKLSKYFEIFQNKDTYSKEFNEITVSSYCKFFFF